VGLLDEGVPTAIERQLASVCDVDKRLQDADAIKQHHHGPTPGPATSRALKALTLGCADNGLSTIRRQYFYLASLNRSQVLIGRVVCVVLAILHSFLGCD
jgi:hypothetical protein